LRDAIWRNRAFLAISVLILALIAASIPVTRWIDARIDARRPLYTDRQMAVWLLYEEKLKGGTIAPATITPGQTATIGSQPFTPSPGNTVVITLQDTKYCVQVTDVDGRHTNVQCWGPNAKPPMPNDTNIDF
jgi:hypothetical protein